MSVKSGNIIQWMLIHGYATHERHAENIYQLLKLGELPRFWQKAKRVIIYRTMRRATGNDALKNLALSYAMEGRRPPKELL